MHDYRPRGTKRVDVPGKTLAIVAGRSCRAAHRMKIAYFVMKFPTPSQTFIEREMLGVVANGLEVEVHPCLDFRRADSLPPPPPGLTVVRAGPLWRVLAAMLAGTTFELVRRPALAVRGLRILLGHWPRHAEGWFMTVWGTLFALARAREFRRREVSWFHGAWATAPATVAAVLGELCGRPFSFGGHAYDLHRHGGDPLLAAKLGAARFVHTTTEANVRSLRERFPRARAEIVLARRGLPRMPPLPAPKADLRGREIRLLSVGRLVEKKGQRYQIDACRVLARRGRDFRLRIIGEGSLHAALAAQIAEAGLTGHIELLGERPSAEVEAAYAWADVFWHTGIVDSQGDRDGLPNVVPEAMAHGLPVISSAVGGAAEAVLDGHTGIIVDPMDVSALADAVERLGDDATLRQRLGEQGRAWVQENFLAEVNTRRLVRAFVGAE